jgi:hypothetical protein
MIYEPILTINLRSWSAVVRGAVARGVELNVRSLVCLRICRRHYGVSISQVFSSWKHSENDAYDDPFDGQKKAKDQMIWLIHKGDAILSTEAKCASVELCRRFGRGDPKVFKTSLVACDEEVAPQRLEDIPIGTTSKRLPVLLLIAFPATRSLATVTYDFERTDSSQIRSIPAVGRGKGYCLVDFKIEISIQRDVRLRVSCNGQEMGSVTVNYT